jgi:hypothetical protein
MATNPILGIKDKRRVIAGLEKAAGHKVTEITQRWTVEQCDQYAAEHGIDWATYAVTDSTLPEYHFEFTGFRNRYSSEALPFSVTSAQFVDRFTKHDCRESKDGKMFSPALFNGSRSNNNFISASGICFDLDHWQPAVEDVLRLFPDTLSAYYSTHSNTQYAPKFRIVLPLSRTVDAVEHAKLVAGIKSIIPPELMECLDTSCFDRARAHYLPSCPPEQQAHAFSGFRNGKLLDADYFIRRGESILSAPADVLPEIQPEPAQSAFEYVDPVSGEVTDLVVWAASNPAFDVVSAIDRQYLRGKPVDGKQHISCPFEDQHTDTSSDLATFAVNASGQHESWMIHCMHSHCVDLDRLEFLLKMLQSGWIPADKLTQDAPELALKHPPYMNYPAREVVEGLQLNPLQPDEFRILLHLMHTSWAAQDGTLPDDDWTLHRSLGISEAEWTEYRNILTRSGWLNVDGSRLFSPLAKREYFKAQAALMAKSAGGRSGGKVTQSKRTSTP